MSTIGTTEWLERAHDHRKALTAQRDDLSQRRGQHEEALAKLEARLAQARDELLAALLPQLDAPAIAGAVQRTGFLPLRQEDPIAARETERAQRQRRLREIDADPRFTDRVELRDPELGSLTRELAEQQRLREPLAFLVERAAHPRLARLIEVGYGTAAYDVPWWRVSYYQDWEAGDEVLEKFELSERFETFAQLRERYVPASEAVLVYDAEIERVGREIAAGQALEREREDTIEALRTLDERHLAKARARLGDHLSDLPVAALAAPLAGTPELLGKRWVGLREQVACLAALCDAQVDKKAQAVATEIAKLDRHIAKYQRPKNASARIDMAETDRRFRDRSESWRKHLQRHDRGFYAVSRFDSYDRGSILGDLLWWDVFTDGRVDGDFIPQVAAFHQSHPGYRYVPVAHDDADAAAVHAGRQGEGDDLGTDAS